MTDDIVTRLQMFSLDDGTDALNKLLAESADEIQRLRAERLDWFLVARQLRDSLWTEQYGAALDSYLRIRGRLEDPRDIDQAVRGG